MLVRIFVRTLTQKFVSIEVDNEEPIEKIKARIVSHNIIPPDQWQLEHKATRLEEHNTLSDYCISHEDTISAQLKPCVLTSNITIRYFLGPAIQVRINGRERVTYFKSYIAEKLNVPFERQRFMYGYKLIGKEELRSYGVRDGSLIEIVPEALFVRNFEKGRKGFVDLDVLCCDY
jgi:hypothetical protein